VKDVLIVGSGFAGLSCAVEAIMRGLSFDCIDMLQDHTSTRIAAGIINPVTGRKYQLQEQYAELFEAATVAYRKIEQLTGKTIMQQLPIFKMHKSEAALEAWIHASRQTEKSTYINSTPSPQKWHKHIDYRYGSILVESGARVDARQLFEGIHALYPVQRSTIQYDDIELKEDYCLWQQSMYKHIIFCEGYQVKNNPWFKHIHIRPSKGECLLVRIPHFNCPVIVQKHTFIVPYGDDRYWVGGTNDFVADDDAPTETKQEELLDGLRDTIRLTFEVEGHFAAIRPTMRDRRPAVGTHPEHHHVHILNGLGTKGALLAPYHAHMLFNKIFNQMRIDPKVDVQRFAL